MHRHRFQTTRAQTPRNRKRRAMLPDMTTFYDLEMTSITGEQVTFDQYKNTFALIVNVASA